MQHQRWRDVVGGRESRQVSAPTFHFYVSDDPLNSPEGIKENDVSLNNVPSLLIELLKTCRVKKLAVFVCL